MDDYASRTSPSAALNVGMQSWTVEAWIKTSDISGVEQVIVSRWECGWNNCASPDGNASSMYILDVTGSGTPRFYVRGDTLPLVLVTGTTDVRDGAWHHIAGVMDRASLTVRIVVDGVEEGTGAMTENTVFNDAGSPLQIGRNFRETFGIPGEYFDGAIDEVRIWSTARTVTQLAASKGTALVGNETGLVGYWRLDNASGTTATDATANGNTLTLGGGATWTTTSAPMN